VSATEALLDAATRRFARLATRLTTRAPGLWPLLRSPLRSRFDRIAHRWNQMVGPNHTAILDAALTLLERPPDRALDLGTGTGAGAVVLARRFPDADVVGADLSPAMIEQATGNLPDELAGRVRFECADGARLPYPNGQFDLVVLLNMIPFYEELARVTARGGTVAICFSRGPQTPIHVPEKRLRTALAEHGFGGFHEVTAGEGTALLARRR
jgi:ubiquinone/menaquinone biosynthesis C-methylase UbiE